MQSLGATGAILTVGGPIAIGIGAVIGLGIFGIKKGIKHNKRK